MKDLDRLLHWPHIDDVIVDLHLEGETVFQACCRASEVEGATSDPWALFTELLSTGNVLLASGETRLLPDLDARGVARICTYEIELADDEADGVLVEPPFLPEPHVRADSLWPALRRNGYKTGREPSGWRDDPTPRARLAELTGVPEPTIYRISTNPGVTVRATTAVRLLEELDEIYAAELDDELLALWRDARKQQQHQGIDYEYVEGLARFAQQARAVTALTNDERQALDDIVWISVAAQRKSFLGTTVAARLDETRRRFQAEHDREPTPLSRRLRNLARRYLDLEGENASARARGLRRGLYRGGAAITPNMVAIRTHRLRRAGRIDANSRPKHYTV